MSLAVSARRHFNAAQRLYEQTGGGDQPGCKAVAGYLFGLSGELAVKQIMRTSGMRPLGAEAKASDPYYAHFPMIKRLLIAAQGRRANELRKIADDPRLFQHWDISMRYAPTGDVDLQWVDQWKLSAHKLINLMGTL